jgi:alpha-tubulin suppressor-like RCC1 family protein
MNITNLIIQLQAKISDSTYNQLAIAKSIELLKTGQVNLVETFSGLPEADTVTGYLYYVLNIGIYFSDGTSWIRMAPLDSDDVVMSWGANGQGQLGDDTVTSRASPVQVVGGFTDWCQASAGNSHSLGLRTEGTLWAWGLNNTGKLGDNTSVNKSSPVSVVGDFTDWCQVSAGYNHSLGLRTTGTAWAWGLNTSGQLGDNTGTNKSSPVSVVGDFTDWCQLSGGGCHSLGTRQNGTIWSWGNNCCQQLGHSTACTCTRFSPVSVVGGFTDWCQVSAGWRFSLGLRQNGTAWAWGQNSTGQLGNGTVPSALGSPGSVVGGFTDWCQVSAGGGHSLGTRQNSTAWAWGRNTNGQLGDDATAQKPSPVSVVGGFTDWCQVSAGYNHSIGARQNSTAWAWGCNTNGQLGDGTATSRSSPVELFGKYPGWCQVSAGFAHSLAVKQCDVET